MARPRSTGPQVVGGGLTSGAGSPVPAAGAGGLPADLNASWRNLMTTIGAGMPYELNRAAAVVRRLHRAVA